VPLATHSLPLSHVVKKIHTIDKPLEAQSGHNNSHQELISKRIYNTSRPEKRERGGEKERGERYLSKNL